MEDAERRVREALQVSNMPALQAQLADATAATATEGLWDDPQARPCSVLGSAQCFVERPFYPPLNRLPLDALPIARLPL